MKDELTVKQLRDFCDWYIKHDSDDIVLSNDRQLDKELYDKRCRDRENDKVLFCDDSMKPRYFNVSCMGSKFSRKIEICKYKDENILMLIPSDEIGD